jgi:hypothetical protein
MSIKLVGDKNPSIRWFGSDNCRDVMVKIVFIACGTNRRMIQQVASLLNTIATVGKPVA